MQYKEYHEENGKVFDPRVLRAQKLPLEQYVEANKSLPMICSDIVVEYNGRALLFYRKDKPAKDLLWCVGGRINKGVPLEDATKDIVKRECNLDLKNLKLLGICRHYWREDPFNHNKGSDNFVFMFFGRGKGKLRLDNAHKKGIILLPEQYTQKFRSHLHPAMQEHLDLAIPLIKSLKKLKNLNNLI